MAFFDDIKHQWYYGTAVMKLIIVNVAIYLLQSLGLLIAYLLGYRTAYIDFLSQWLWASSDLRELITKPWTLVTYMFLHDPIDIFHIVSNMIYLFFFGRIFSDFIQQKMAYPLYFAGGFIGFLLAIITFNVAPAYQGNIGAPFVGASAAVMAIVLASTTLAPNLSVNLFLLGPVKLKYIAAFVVVVDLLSIPGEMNIGGHIAHLGGALFGYLYIRSYRNSGNWFSWWPKFERRIYGLFNRKKMRVAYVHQRPDPDDKRTKEIEDQKKLDAILDKIKASGYESLSKHEKEFLFRMSKEK
jgi:membrane associated rhomboid family serine protease